MFKLSEVRLFKKKCSKCGEVHLTTEFHKDSSKKYGFRPSCKKCKRKEDKNRYDKQCGSYIYIIKVDNVPWYIGSTNNMPHRISKNINNEDNGHFIYMCKQKGRDLDNKDIAVYICDTEKMGYNLTREDLRYYEHVLIRKCKEYGYPLLNTVENSRYIYCERYIDQIPFDGFKFELSHYKLI